MEISLGYGEGSDLTKEEAFEMLFANRPDKIRAFARDCYSKAFKWIENRQKTGLTADEALKASLLLQQLDFFLCSFYSEDGAKETLSELLAI